MTREMTKIHSLELRVPPVIVFFIVVGGIWTAAWFTPNWSFVTPWEEIASSILSLLGVAFGLSGVASFTRAHTTTDPVHPEKASAIVQTGVYRLSRNPMYLGLLFFLVALIYKLGNPTGIVFLPVFLLYINRFQIVPEERSLLAQFGDEYAAYKSRVRRWL